MSAGGVPLRDQEIDARLEALSGQRFRAKFHLRGRERATVELRGMEAIQRAAEEIVVRRLAPAAPANDGRQTPYRGHPVFIAQHATATCCRRCLARNHGIPAVSALSGAEQAYVVRVISRWVEQDFTAQSAGRTAPR